MSYEFLLRPPQAGHVSTVDAPEANPCTMQRGRAASSLLYLAPNADVGRHAFDRPLHDVVPATNATAPALCPVTSQLAEYQAPHHPPLNALAPTTSSAQAVSLHSPTVSTAPALDWRGGPGTASPSGLSAIYSMGNPELAAVQGVTGLLQSISETIKSISDRISKMQATLDQSGFMVAPIIKVVWKFPDQTRGNARLQGYFEWAKKDLETDQRKFILTGSAGTTLRNPLGAGAYSGRYSLSTDPERQGYNQVFQTTLKKVGGVGLEDSKTQGQFFSIWKEESIGLGMSEDLFRLDYVTSLGRWFWWARPHTYLRALPAFQDVPSVDLDIMVGADIVIYSPALKDIPGYNQLGHSIASVFRIHDKIQDRVVNNRANYEHETNMTKIISSLVSEPVSAHASGTNLAGSGSTSKPSVRDTVDDVSPRPSMVVSPMH